MNLRVAAAVVAAVTLATIAGETTVTAQGWLPENEPPIAWWQCELHLGIVKTYEPGHHTRMGPPSNTSNRVCRCSGGALNGHRVKGLATSGHTTRGLLIHCVIPGDPMYN